MLTQVIPALDRHWSTLETKYGGKGCGEAQRKQRWKKHESYWHQLFWPMFLYVMLFKKKKAGVNLCGYLWCELCWQGTTSL